MATFVNYIQKNADTAIHKSELDYGLSVSNLPVSIAGNNG
jgi:hypothetical protein